MTGIRRKVAVALSGGVDSSVAAYLLQRDPRNDLVALHMSNWDAQDEEDVPSGCLEQDMSDAEAVCRHLKLPLHKTSFAAEYWTTVFQPFVEGIVAGTMPNPDAGCNSRIKFGAMKEYAHRKLGADWIATGHYARLWDRQENTASECLERVLQDHGWLYKWGKRDPLLLAGFDKSKDQSYFLAGVKGYNFRNVIFPLGDFVKSGNVDQSVRHLAEVAQLPNASKRESMGICFVGKRNFASFISQYLPSLPPSGDFVDVDTGRVVGQHRGSLYYTIGQGARISGASHKWFVVGRAHDNVNTVLVCGNTHHPALYSDDMIVSDMTWIGGGVPPPLIRVGRMRVQCRIRHLQPLIDCEISVDKTGHVEVYFDRPIRAITKGQMAVVYIGDVCLGGGPILERGASYHERGRELPSELHPAGHNDLSVQTA
jgi:tRNA-specific 2-thiouridylase